MGIHFLHLPVDILSIILAPLLVSKDRIELCTCGLSPPGDVDHLPLMLTHPALDAIAGPIFYECNEFALDARGALGPHVRRCLEDTHMATAAASKSLPGQVVHEVDDCHARDVVGQSGLSSSAGLLAKRRALRRVKRLRVYIDTARQWIEVLLVPLLSDMILSGSLTALTLVVRIASSKQASAPPDEAFARRPLTSLVRLLGDPYLRERQLWVSAAHEAQAQEDKAGRRMVCAGHEYVQVDWRAAVRITDPEGGARVTGVGRDVFEARGRGYTADEDEGY